MVLIQFCFLSLHAWSQCNGCTTTISGASGSTFTVNVGEKLCLAASAQFTGRVRLQGGELENCATAPQDFEVILNSSSTPGSRILNHGTMIIAATFWALEHTTTFENYGTLHTSPIFEVATNSVFNNHGIVDGIHLNAASTGQFNNHGDINSFGTTTVFPGGIMVNSPSGTYNANRLDIDGLYTNQGTVNLIDDFRIRSSGQLINDGGCIFTNDFLIQGSLTGLTCGTITANNSTVVDNIPALIEGNIAIVDLSPPANAPFVDSNNGTIDPSVNWVSCGCPGSNPPENCNNGVDDDGDGLIDCLDPDCNGNSSCPDADNDGFSDLIDLDDDNDGILDTDENQVLSLDDEVWATLDDGSLYRIKDPLGAPVVSLIGNTGLLGDIGFNSKGVLYAAGFALNQFYTIDTANANLTPVPNPPQAPAPILTLAPYALTFDTADIGYISYATSTEIYRWDPATGITTLWGVLPGVIGGDFLFQGGKFFALVEDGLDISLYRSDLDANNDLIGGFTKITPVLDGEAFGIARTLGGEIITTVDSDGDTQPELEQLIVSGTSVIRVPINNTEIPVLSSAIFGLSGIYEAFATLEKDFDEDGLANHLDLDSDNDGIYDCVEAGHGEAFATGQLNGGVDSFGIPLTVSDGLGGVTYTLVDSDLNGVHDAIQLDADADGCFDVVEAGYSDANKDGFLGSSPLTVDPITGLVTSGGL